MNIKLHSRKYRNLYAVIDNEDYDLIKDYRWSPELNGRTFRTQAWDKYCGKNVRMHRLIVKCPENMEIDHIDHDPLNNRKSNLRIVTHAQNSKNCSPRIINMYSKYKGVTYLKSGQRKKRWMARIRTDYKEIFLGYFDTEKEAMDIYDKASGKYHGKHGLGNVI